MKQKVAARLFRSYGCPRQWIQRRLLPKTGMTVPELQVQAVAHASGSVHEYFYSRGVGFSRGTCHQL
jgi:hypothetical protein